MRNNAMSHCRHTGDNVNTVRDQNWLVRLCQLTSSRRHSSRRQIILLAAQEMGISAESSTTEITYKKGLYFRLANTIRST
jgi:hypothetical protein